MGVAERRARGKEALRHTILNAAIELMVAEGFDNLSIRKIADRIEYAPSTIYLYFKDKYEIVATVCEDTFDQLTAELQSITTQESDPVSALHKGLRAYIDFGLSHPSHYLVTFCAPIPVLPPDHPTHGFDASMRCYHHLLDGVVKCIEANRMIPLEANLVSQALWSSIHGITSILITAGHDKCFPWADRETLIETQLRGMLRGLLTQPADLPLA